ncbi:hypothetical protein Tco_0221934 [Tanacetum coccineum]
MLLAMFDGPTAGELRSRFLELCMANVMSKVILALLSHLRPVPYPWGGKALQLLRKLGSRNRRCLKEPLAFESVMNKNSAMDAFYRKH